MVTDSESFFQRTLNEKTKEARAAVQACVRSFLSVSPNKRQAAAQTAIDAVGRIVDMLHPNDRPPWLDPLHAALKVAHSNHNDNQGIESIQRVANDYQIALNKHEWRLVDLDGTTGFDFDSVYNKFKVENRIPELFDQMISALSDIVSSGAIDSVRALEELRRILATLQTAKNGSYFATSNAWAFVAAWFKNTGWEVLGDIPVLGPALRGLRKTFEDTDQGMKSLEQKIRTELQVQYSKDFPRLQYRTPDLSRLEYCDDSDVGESREQDDTRGAAESP